MWLLILPSLFMLIGLLALEIVDLNNKGGQPVTIDQKTLFQPTAFVAAFGLIAALYGAHLALCFIAPDADQTLLPLAGTLSAIGVLMALRLGPDLGQNSLGAKQLVFVIVGLVLCVVTVWGTRSLRWIRDFKYTWAVLGIVLVGVTLVNARRYAADAPNRDVLSLGSGGLSFQPSELLKICLVIFFAGYLAENREILAEGYRIGPLTLPPIKQLGPLLAMLGVALLIFLGVHELGLAILIFGLFLAMIYAASGRMFYVVGGLAAFALGAFVIYTFVGYAQQRVAIVATAFDPNVEPNQGYQLVRGLIAFGTGGFFGTGLGLGQPTLVPAATTDYIAAAFAEEFGFAGLLALIGVFMLLVYRGMHVAASGRDNFNKLMAIGLTSVFALQTVVILAGDLKLMPLTGVPLPFVAYGGSSLVANYIIIGLMLRLSRTDV